MSLLPVLGRVNSGILTGRPKGQTSALTLLSLFLKTSCCRGNMLESRIQRRIFRYTTEEVTEDTGNLHK